MLNGLIMNSETAKIRKSLHQFKRGRQVLSKKQAFALKVFLNRRTKVADAFRKLIGLREKKTAIKSNTESLKNK